MADPKQLLRSILAQMCPDPRAIKAFEQLFEVVPKIEEIVIDIIVNYSNSDVVSGQIVALNQLVSQLAQAPNEVIPNLLFLDAVNFNQFKQVLEQLGQLSFNKEYGTLQIVQSLDVQPIGFNTYLLGLNNTGSTISRGKVVSKFSASSSNLEIEEFISDGTLYSENILGMTVGDILDGEIGLVMVRGKFLNYDTSSFSTGENLYSSSSTLGGIVNIIPTAPSLKVQIGVSLDSSISGSIYINPIVVFSNSYGEFITTTDVVASLPNTPYAIEFSTASINYGTEIDGAFASRINILSKGLYKIHVIGNLTNSVIGSHNVNVWYQKNGTNIDNSLISSTCSLLNEFLQIENIIFTNLDIGDYIEIMYSVDNVALFFDYVAAAGGLPAKPSVNLIVEQVR